MNGPNISKVALTILCLALGAGPDRAQQTAQPPSSQPASPSKSKMTNADVIQLVTAGLSEQVVIGSIRQAPEKGFDLTPTGLIALKKTGVPDAVILVMQNGDAPVKPAAPSDDMAVAVMVSRSRNTVNPLAVSA